MISLSGYYGGYYRPYYHGYWYGKRQADEPAASGPNPDADAHGWGELLHIYLTQFYLQLNLSGYYGGYYRPYWGGYYWGK